ncbi:MAG: O-antigen ligase family protein [Verrucomicrobiaceae bacterium]|nr:O-antigen ligase family protein [Verrucomicrobiaceae bacterium]
MTSLSETLEPAAISHAGQEVISPETSDDRGIWNYRVALIFLFLYYIRPQDWVPGMAGVNIVRLVMIIWIVVMMAEGLNSPLRGFFRTPHDWAMLAFYVYVVWNAPAEAGAGMGMLSLVVFYYLTTQALSSWSKLLGYLRFWNWLLITIALFGVLQTLGIDITGGKDVTEYGRGRLALGTWTCNNPNALGHTVAAAIPLSYMMFFWRANMFSRIVMFPAALTLIVECTWETQSKGSFLVAAGLLVLVFVVGRPKWIQVIVVASALTAGVGALSFLPRMESMGSLRSEEGVMGRLMVWEAAYQACQNNTTGVGWRQFMGWITVQEGTRWIVQDKSTHSSYVQVGADLGKVGMFLWVLILICALRSIAFYKAEDETQERCRRAILLLLTAYMTSSWMINREYHTEYYLIAAMAAAFHRLAAARILDASEETDKSDDTALAVTPASVGLPWAPPGSGPVISLYGEPVSPKRIWLRLDWKDIVMAWAATWGVLQLWDYLLKNL